PGCGRPQEHRARRRADRRLAGGLLRARAGGRAADGAAGGPGPGRAGPGRAGRTLAGFDIVPTVPLVVGANPRACADPVRAYAALYVGGMGSREQNFYNNIARRMGFEAEAREGQALSPDRKQGEAAAAVPYEFIDRTSLL